MPDDALKRLAANLDAECKALDEFLRVGPHNHQVTEKSLADARRSIAYEIAVIRHRERFARAKSLKRSELFSDPAMDILLDLYIHQSRAEPAVLRNVLVSSSGSATTALRWLKVLAKEGYVSLPEDLNGDDRGQLSLTDEGFESMTSYLCELSAIGLNLR